MSEQSKAVMPEMIYINHNDMMDIQANIKSADGNDTTYVRADNYDQLKECLKDLVWLHENHDGNHKLENKDFLNMRKEAMLKAYGLLK